MKEELDKKLCEDFPHLYQDRHGDMRNTCMVWGFPGDGWEKPIRKLSEKLTALIEKLPEDQRQHYKAVQVKEKFGGLRFYMSGETDEMSDAIREAEDECDKTCESCGTTENVYQKGIGKGPFGWIKTYCIDCRVDEGVRRELESRRIDYKRVKRERNRALQFLREALVDIPKENEWSEQVREFLKPFDEKNDSA